MTTTTVAANNPQSPAPLNQNKPESQADWQQLLNQFQSWQSLLSILVPPIQQTDAERTAGVTPTNYAYAPSPWTDGRRYGIVGDGTTDNTTALNNAFSALGNGGTLYLPPGIIKFSGNITLPANSCSIRGAAKGNGVYESTTLVFTGSGVAITVAGYYCVLADFSLDNAGTGTVGIRLNGNYLLCERVSCGGSSAGGTVAWSIAAFQSNPSSTSFSHTLRSCYTSNHNCGWHIPRGNNFVSDNSFFEFNKTNILVGDISTVTNFVMCNGTVTQLGGKDPSRPQEIDSSINVDLRAVKGFTVRDSYFEVDGSSVVSSANQLGVSLGLNCEGGAIEANWFFGGGQAVNAIAVADSTVNAVKITCNEFNDFNGYGVGAKTGGSVAQVTIDNNAAPSPTLGEYAATWTPVLNLGGSTTGITYAANGQIGTWQRLGKWLIAKCTIALSSKGTATGSATITGLPLAHMSSTNTEDTAAVSVANMASVAGTVTAQVTALTPTTVRILTAGAGGAQVALADTNLNNNSYLNFTLMYQVAA